MGTEPGFAPDIDADGGGSNVPDISGLLGAASRLLEGIAGLGEISTKIKEAADGAVGAIAIAQTTATTAVERVATDVEMGKQIALDDIEKKKAAALKAIADATPTVFEAAEETDNFPV